MHVLANAEVVEIITYDVSFFTLLHINFCVSLVLGLFELRYYLFSYWKFFLLDFTKICNLFIYFTWILFIKPVFSQLWQINVGMKERSRTNFCSAMSGTHGLDLFFFPVKCKILVHISHCGVRIYIYNFDLWFTANILYLL